MANIKEINHGRYFTKTLRVNGVSTTKLKTRYLKMLIIIFGIYTRCQQMKVRVMCRKFECREDIYYKTQLGNDTQNKQIKKT